MTQRSQSRLAWGIRLIALTVILVLACSSYKREGFLGLIGVLLAVALGVLWQYPTRQGEKLAILNMKKYGFEPDRDEALPARKAIDN